MLIPYYISSPHIPSYLLAPALIPHQCEIWNLRSSDSFPVITNNTHPPVQGQLRKWQFLSGPINLLFFRVQNTARVNLVLISENVSVIRYDGWVILKIILILIKYYELSHVIWIIFDGGSCDAYTVKKEYGIPLNKRYVLFHYDVITVKRIRFEDVFGLSKFVTVVVD